MSYVVKTSDIVEARGTALMVRERPMYGGEDIKSGDSIFIWSSGKGGRLVGRGRVTAVLDGQGDSVIGRGGDTLTLHLTDVDWGVRGSLTTQDLVPFRDLTIDGPMEVLARLLYRHAHNKIACLPEQAAALLAEMFEVQTSSAEVPAAPPRRFSKLAIIGAFVCGVLILGLLVAKNIVPTAAIHHAAQLSAAVPTGPVTKVGTHSVRMESYADNPDGLASFQKEINSRGQTCAAVTSTYRVIYDDVDRGIYKINCNGNLSYLFADQYGRECEGVWNGIPLDPDQLATIGCKSTSENASNESSASDVTNRRTLPTREITVSKSSGAYELMQLRPVPAANEAAQGDIASAGYECTRVTGVAILVENSVALPVSKADCADGKSYQITTLNGREFIKPWTGTLIGK